MNKPTKNLVLCELADTGIDGLESYSPFCLKVHRALRAAGLSYTRKHGNGPIAFRSLNPAGQVPVLLADNEAIYDSTEILARLESLGGRALLPTESRARAEALLWEELADTTLNGFVVAARWADDRNWHRTRDAYFDQAPWFVKTLIVPRLRSNVCKALVARDVWRHGEAHCWKRFSQVLTQLEARTPAHGFWIGSEISVADVALFGQLQSLRTPLTPWQREELERKSALCRYLDRVDAATQKIVSLEKTKESIVAVA